MAQVLRIDGEFGCSLVCIGSVLSLAVVPTALQKLHKCVTQNTTELLQDTDGGREGEEDALKNRSLKKRPHRGLLLRFRVLNTLRIHFVLALKHDITSTGAVLCLRLVSVDKRLNSLNVTQGQF